jgi:hypothetical protein
VRKTPLMQRVEQRYGGRDIAALLNEMYLAPSCRGWRDVAARLSRETGIPINEATLYPWLRRIRESEPAGAVA